MVWLNETINTKARLSLESANNLLMLSGFTFLIVTFDV